MFKTLDFAQFEANLRQMDAILTDIETGKSRVGQFVMGTQLYVDIRQRVADVERSIRAAASTTTDAAQAPPRKRRANHSRSHNLLIVVM